jgi:chorismate synthase
VSALRYLTAGESHGPALIGILEGLPAGLPLTSADLDAQLARRQHGLGAGSRMKIERDHAQILGGVLSGQTTGAPLALRIENLDHSRWADRDIAPMTVPRPGHADLVGAIKYGYRDLRLSLERASARETAMRVALSAACRVLLQHHGVQVGGYVVRIGQASWEPPLVTDPAEFPARWNAAEVSEVRCPDAVATAGMVACVKEHMHSRNTVGGVIEVVATGLPPGLGSFVHADRRLSAAIAAAMCSIPSVRGVEFGTGFGSAELAGTAAQDGYALDGDDIRSDGRHSGGLEGGVTTGAPLRLRVACKPIATTLSPQPSVDLARGAAAPTEYERSDFCHVPRAVPIVEALLCLVLADALCEKLGGDSLAEQQVRLATLRRAKLSQLPMDNQAWRFGYER